MTMDAAMAAIMKDEQMGLVHLAMSRTGASRLVRPMARDIDGGIEISQRLGVPAQPDPHATAAVVGFGIQRVRPEPVPLEEERMVLDGALIGDRRYRRRERFPRIDRAQLSSLPLSGGSAGPE